MTQLIAILFCTLGFAACASSMVRHQTALLGRRVVPRVNTGIRVLAAGSMAMALVVDMGGLGAGYGAVAWFGHLTIGAMLMLVVVRRA